MLPVERYGRYVRIPTPTGFAVGDVNTYAILPSGGAPGPVLVDTGVRSDEAWEALRAGLRRYGFDVADIQLVLLTHAHPDHFGQAARIRREAGCEVWVHEAGERSLRRYTEELAGEPLEVARQHMRAWGVPEERTSDVRGPERARDVVEPLVPDRWLRDGEVVELADVRLRAIHTPGHCPDHIVYVDEQRRVALSGDHLLPDITPVCLLQLPTQRDGERPSSLMQYCASLQKMQAMEADLVLPSHGDVIRDHPALIASYRARMDERRCAVLSAFAGAEATAYEVGRRLFADAIDDQLFLVLSEIVGHLDVLEAEGTLESRSVAGRTLFRPMNSSELALAGA